MNGYEPQTQFEQYVVDELRHITNHLRDVESDVKGLLGFTNRVKGQASLLGAVAGAAMAWVVRVFSPHGH